MYIKNSRSPAPSRTIVLYTGYLSLEKLPQEIYLFHEAEIAASFAKVIIICENNYSR